MNATRWAAPRKGSTVETFRVAIKQRIWGRLMCRAEERAFDHLKGHGDQEPTNLTLVFGWELSDYDLIRIASCSFS